MRLSRRSSLLSGWICLLLFSGLDPTPASACSCATTLERSLKESDLVFHGRLVETTEKFDLTASLKMSLVINSGSWSRWLDTWNPSYLGKAVRFWPTSQQENHFRVLAVYKGEVGAAVTVYSPPNSGIGNCNLPFLVGQEYLVFARDTGFGLMSVNYETDMCTATGEFLPLVETPPILGPARPPTFQPRPAVLMGLLVVGALGGLGWFLQKRRASAPA